jgi:hypothetical protein
MHPYPYPICVSIDINAYIYIYIYIYTYIYIYICNAQLTPVEGECHVVVLCHTRELAFQIQREYERFSKYMPDTKSRVFYGGRYRCCVCGWMDGCVCVCVDGWMDVCECVCRWIGECVWMDG